VSLSPKIILRILVLEGDIPSYLPLDIQLGPASSDSISKTKASFISLS